MGYPLEVGEDCTVGHNTILHGCSIGEDSLIGMGSVVLNGARIGRGCLVGARALVTEGKVFADFLSSSVRRQRRSACLTKRKCAALVLQPGIMWRNRGGCGRTDTD